MAATTSSAPTEPQSLGRQDQTMLLFAQLMEGGKEDDDTVADLAKLTRLLDEDVELAKKGEPSITSIVDADCFDTIVCYLDLRQAEKVRAHATFCTSSYLKAAGQEGIEKLSEFFHARIKRGTYDDYIVAFCVAAAIFPIMPDITTDLFLTEGFLPSLAPLMRRKWKSRKVETACLEMLNAACMQSKCIQPVLRYCDDWLEEIASQDPDDADASMHSTDPDMDASEGSISMRQHSKHVRHLAELVLVKTRAVPLPPSGNQPDQGLEPRVQSAVTSIEDLSQRFAKMLAEDPEHVHISVEGLAYATIQSKIKEELARDQDSLKRLVKALETAPPKSPLTYGALSIFFNLTRYRPVETEEQKRLNQLKAYANAGGKLQTDPLNDDAHVAERCKRVFEAGITPALATRAKTSSAASLSLIIAIIYSLSVTPSLRGQLAQQGAVRLLIAAWSALPETEPETQPRRTAAQALARILISTNPSLIFRQTSQSTAIRPLTSIIAPDPTAETRDLLPTFESLLALTNLASTDNDTRHLIVRIAWDDIEEQLFSSNTRVSTAAAELLCNLVQSPADALALFGDGSAKADTRIKVVLALADAEDEKTRSAAGGALASLTGLDVVVRGVLAQPRGAAVVLGLCRDENEGLRHRGAVVVDNMLSHEGEVGELAREKLVAAGAVEALAVCAKKSRSTEVVHLVVQCLEVLLGEK